MPLRLKQTAFAFLLGIYPILSTYAHNIFYVQPQQIVVPILLILLFTLSSLFVFKFLFKDLTKAAIYTGILWLIWFSYSALHEGLVNLLGYIFITKQSVLLLLLMSALLYLAYHIRKYKVSYKVIKLVHFISFVLLLLPLLTITRYHFKEMLARPDSELKLKNEISAAVDKDSLPDIIYIILDGYGRGDMLKKNYSLDNSAFLDSLREYNFTIAPQSYSNYCRTAVTTASVFNINYLQNLNGYDSSQSYDVLDQLIERSRLVNTLKQHNYNIYSFASGFDATELKKNATFIDPHPSSLNDFHFLLLSLTPFIVVENNPFLYKKYTELLSLLNTNRNPAKHFRDFHRDRILYALDSIPSHIGRPKPSFVFADVFAGHPPFIFDQNGNYTRPTTKNPAADGSEYMNINKKSRKEYIDGCRDQIIYLNRKLLHLVKDARRRSTRPTVIILQGDHGPGAYYDQHKASKTNLQDRFSILTAVYFSGKSSAEIPEDLSPVNTFRIVLNKYFSAKLPLLPNKHYYSGLLTPCEFEDITQQL